MYNILHCTIHACIVQLCRVKQYGVNTITKCKWQQIGVNYIWIHDYNILQAPTLRIKWELVTTSVDENIQITINQSSAYFNFN